MHVIQTEKPDQTSKPPPSPPARAVRLKTLADCRRAGATCYNLLLKQKITESEARARGYLLQIISGLITTADLEQRIAKIEKSLEKR